MELFAKTQIIISFNHLEERHIEQIPIKGRKIYRVEFNKDNMINTLKNFVKTYIKKGFPK
jgi:hypothetical protein